MRNLHDELEHVSSQMCNLKPSRRRISIKKLYDKKKFHRHQRRLLRNTYKKNCEILQFICYVCAVDAVEMILMEWRRKLIGMRNVRHFRDFFLSYNLIRFLLICGCIGFLSLRHLLCLWLKSDTLFLHNFIFAPTWVWWNFYVHVDTFHDIAVRKILKRYPVLLSSFFLMPQAVLCFVF